MSSPILILGSGLAGSCLAWQLQSRGVPFLMLDRDTGDGSSRVAGGLITPITGQRLVPSWRFGDFFPVAERFYRRIESETGIPCFYRKSAVRLFRNAAEVAKRGFETIELDAENYHAPLGGFEMADSAYLDTSAFLDASRHFFRERGCFRQAEIDVANEVELRPDGLVLPRLELAATKLIFCQGDFGRSNPWFDFIEFNSAKGEILTLYIPGLPEERVLHGRVWMLPLGNERFRVGSTYQWHWVDSLPSEDGREEILTEVRCFLKRPFEVVRHEAGIRPILQPLSRPVVGFHAKFPQLGFFNGLGSKGCLLAPYFSEQLADMLTGTLEPVLLASQERVRIRPTEEVHRLLRETLQPGETAIDATAGNGQDTLVLSHCVGATGQVYAFDIQAEAVKRIEARLAAEQVSNVTLIQRSHDEIGPRFLDSHRGKIGAIVFNLGYLPRGDKSITTHPDSTIPALEASLELLRPGGGLSVVAYTGHPGGIEERTAVGRLLHELPESEFSVTEISSDPDKAEAPRLFAVRKLV